MRAEGRGGMVDIPFWMSDLRSRSVALATFGLQRLRAARVSVCELPRPLFKSVWGVAAVELVLQQYCLRLRRGVGVEPLAGGVAPPPPYVLSSMRNAILMVTERSDGYREALL